MYTHSFFAPWYSSPFAGMFLPFTLLLFPLLVLVAIWSIGIKGYALWHAARNKQLGWFIALLVFNTLGILELVYLIWFCPEHHYKRRTNHSSHSHHPEVSSKTQE